MNTNIIGNSLPHFAIVAVEAKGTKPTKAAKDAAIAATIVKKPSRHVIDATFSRVEEIDGVKNQVYLVQYVRPAKK